MRNAKVLILELAKDMLELPDVCIAQFASQNGVDYWPELREESFRVDLEKGMKSMPGVAWVMFTPPENGTDWGFYVMRSKDENPFLRVKG